RHRSFFAAQRARLLRAGRALPRPSREGSMSLTRVGETSGGSRSGSRNNQQAQEVAEVKEDDAEIILPQRKSAPQHYGAATYPRSKHKSGRLECPRWKTKT
ncbi:unnamed protein product, partial [Prorocentrum cordatum]